MPPRFIELESYVVATEVLMAITAGSTSTGSTRSAGGSSSRRCSKGIAWHQIFVFFAVVCAVFATVHAAVLEDDDEHDKFARAEDNIQMTEQRPAVAAAAAAADGGGRRTRSAVAGAPHKRELGGRARWLIGYTIVTCVMTLLISCSVARRVGYRRIASWVAFEIAFLLAPAFAILYAFVHPGESAHDYKKVFRWVNAHQVAYQVGYFLVNTVFLVVFVEIRAFVKSESFHLRSEWSSCTTRCACVVLIMPVAACSAALYLVTCHADGGLVPIWLVATSETLALIAGLEVGLVVLCGLVTCILFSWACEVNGRKNDVDEQLRQHQQTVSVGRTCPSWLRELLPFSADRLLEGRRVRAGDTPAGSLAQDGN